MQGARALAPSLCQITQIQEPFMGGGGGGFDDWACRAWQAHALVRLFTCGLPRRVEYQETRHRMDQPISATMLSEEQRQHGTASLIS